MAAKKRRILVTGVARWWGALVVQRLGDDPDVAEVIGIDIREPRYDLGRADYLKLDIRHSLIGKRVRAVGIDTVVHTLPWVDSFDLDPRRAHEMNVIGTLNLLAGCAGADSPVKRFVLKSSGHVYGSRYDLQTNLREDHRLDSNSKHQFVRDIVEVESYVSDFADRNPGIDLVTLRFSNSLNPNEPQPLARYLDLEFVPTVAGYDPILQLIHRDDCVEALYLATKRGPAGAYNISASGAGCWLLRTAKAKKLAFRLRVATAPIDDKHLSVHVARGVRDQEHHRAGDLVGNADAAHRIGAEHAIENRLIGPERLGEARLHEARRYGVDAHLPPELSSNLAAGHAPAGLRAVVVAEPEAGSDPADAGHVDDGAAVGLH